MKLAQESIFSSAVRSFVMTFFAIVGIGAALIPIVLLFGIIMDSDSFNIRKTTTPYIAANAEGERVSFHQNVPVILKLNIEGVIGSENMTYEKFRAKLMESREGIFTKNKVKAIMLTINSPGGVALDSDAIYRALKDYKEDFGVPIYAYVEGICASGAMHIASAADKIYASNVSIIGSIGSIFPPFFNISKPLNKLGIESMTLYSGHGKDMLSPLRPWNPDESKSMQTLLDYMYEHLVNTVTSERPTIDKDKLVNEYGAGVFVAKDAMKRGFIDGIGYNERSVLKEIVENTDLDGKDYQVIELESQRFFPGIFEHSSLLKSGTVKHRLDISSEFSPELMGKFLYLYRPGQ